MGVLVRFRIRTGEEDGTQIYAYGAGSQPDRGKSLRGGREVGPIGQANTMREEWVTLDSFRRLNSQVEERSEGAEWSGRRT
jgi:hypothetical protein